MKKTKEYNREDMIKSLEEITKKLDADSQLLQNMKRVTPSKKLFAPSMMTYKVIQVLSSFGIWFMTFWFGYPIWHTIIVCVLLCLLTWSTHVKGAAMGMLLATKSKNLRSFINGND